MMDIEKFIEGPGSLTAENYVWHVALIVFVPFLLGYWLRSILNSALKTKLKNAENEKLKLLTELATLKKDSIDGEIYEKEILNLKAELESTKLKVSNQVVQKINAENERNALQLKLDALKNTYESEKTEVKTEVETKTSSSYSSAIIPAESATQSSGFDDLKKVEGIGPKIEQLLNEDGIKTYTDLVSASVDRIKGVLIAAGPNYAVHDPSTWGEQAQLANEGKWEALDLLQEDLKGGKRKS